MNTSSKRGFTLLELIVVIGIFGAILAFSVPAYQSYARTQRLKQTTERLGRVLMTARDRAITTGSRELIHVNTTGGVNWHIHSYPPAPQPPVIIYGEKFPAGITPYTVTVSPEFTSDGRSRTSGYIVLKDDLRSPAPHETLSVLHSGLVLAR